MDRAVLDAMTDRLAHRGPDDRGTYASDEDGVGLGFRRLSIIDLSPAGHQPMCNEDGTLWLVFNGEIYNFKALRIQLEQKGHVFKSDTDSETILHGYEEWGVEVVQQLDGMFAFALWDQRKKQLFAARDRYGIKPLVYACWPEGMAFASELKSLMAIPALPKTLDLQALWTFLSFAQIPAPYTIYRGMHKLLPGHRLICRAGDVCVERYYRLPSQPTRTAKGASCAEELREIIIEAVRSHLVADVPVGCYLSGGLDSSLIAAIAAKIQPGIKTFSVTFPEHPVWNEELFQRKMAERIGSDHHVVEGRLDMTRELAEIYQGMDEPFAISSFVPLHKVTSLAARHVKVVLSGDGGDEVFAGYEGRYRFDQGYDLLRFLPAGWVNRDPWGPRSRLNRLRRRARLARLARGERYLSSFNWFDSFEKTHLLQPDLLRCMPSDLLEHTACAFDETVEGDVRWKRYGEFQSCLPDEMLRKTDGATSAFSLEGRVPLLDKTVVEWAWSLPEASHWKDGRGKQLLKEAARGLVPDEIIDRPKAGFSVPVHEWMMEAKSPVRAVLAEPVLSFDRLVRPDSLQAIVQATESGRKDLSSKLWVLAVLKLWMREHPEAVIG